MQLSLDYRQERTHQYNMTTETTHIKNEHKAFSIFIETIAIHSSYYMDSRTLNFQLDELHKLYHAINNNSKRHYITLSCIQCQTQKEYIIYINEDQTISLNSSNYHCSNCGLITIAILIEYITRLQNAKFTTIQQINKALTQYEIDTLQQITALKPISDANNTIYHTRNHRRFMQLDKTAYICKKCETIIPLQSNDSTYEKAIICPKCATETMLNNKTNIIRI
ncbi:MAG: hypothetical protein Q7R33_01380 [Nitrosarchaeum sp.]|nr:hypothetical protein [Nitrosarchaeum sp.]